MKISVAFAWFIAIFHPSLGIVTRYDPVYEITAGYACPTTRTEHDLPVADSWQTFAGFGKQSIVWQSRLRAGSRCPVVRGHRHTGRGIMRTGQEDLSKCGTSAGCLRSPDGCKGDACDVAALWSKGATSGTVDFEITAKGNSYVAIGFSKDKNMGDDSVIDCINKDNKVFVRPSYNEKNTRSNSELPKVSAEDAGLTLTSSSSTGGFITCKFTRNVTVSGQAEVFDLSAQKYYVMLAYGSLRGDGTKRQHASNARMRSKIPVDLLATKDAVGSSEGTGRKTLLHKVHGVLMIGAWTVAAAMGMFVARHYKPAWPNSKLLDTKVWFVLHRTLMVLALLCTVAAFIIIFVQVKEYTEVSGDSNFKQSHPPMGIVITALVIINPIMTFFRCHPGAKYRALFDWAHFSVGMSALILSFINVFSGIKLGGFSDNVMWVMATYIVFYVIIMLVMEAHKCSKCSGAGKSKSMELRSKSSSVTTEPSPPSLTFKYSMLIIFMSVSVGLFSVMLILVVES